MLFKTVQIIKNRSYDKKKYSKKMKDEDSRRENVKLMAERFNR